MHRLALVLLVLSCSREMNGQADSLLQALDAHFTGEWVGVQRDFTKTPTTSSTVRIAIREEPKKRQLRLEYWYGVKGKKGYDHAVRFMKIEPAKSVVELHWQGSETEVYRASGLEEVLKAGYGAFTCLARFHVDTGDEVYRWTVRIEADHLQYAWEKSTDLRTFKETAEWELTRQQNSLPTTPSK